MNYLSFTASLVISLLFCLECQGVDSKQPDRVLVSHSLSAPEPTVFAIEYAHTHEQRTWGLMQKRSLPQNSALMFSYSTPQIISLWSFNCWIDLAVAFLDRSGIVRELCTLKAYPEKMDPQRPVHTLSHMKLYPYNDPICQFFLKQSVCCTIPCSFACEAGVDFYSARGVKLGDAMICHGSQGKILSTQDLSPYLLAGNKICELPIDGAKPIALWATEHKGMWLVEFYDNNGQCLQKSLLYGGKGQTAEYRHVIYCAEPVSLLRVKKY